MLSPSPRFSLPVILLAVCLTMASVSGFSGCANARTSALERRQDRMNDRTSERAERRAIRSENADARSDALFDAM
ncbi:MAG: hypothetical protein IAE94_15500 [Chthoniobacterales bacterium]|nr:hypothetical protein [Chthoniobacterales bacterium]